MRFAELSRQAAELFRTYGAGVEQREKRQQYSSICPAHQDCAGGVAGAYGDQKDQVAFVEALLCYGVHHA